MELPLRISREEVVTGDWFEVRSPQSGELLARVAKAGPGEIDRAIGGAAEGFGETRRLPAHRRADGPRAIGEQGRRQRAGYRSGIGAEAGKTRPYPRAEVA